MNACKDCIYFLVEDGIPWCIRDAVKTKGVDYVRGVTWDKIKNKIHPQFDRQYAPWWDISKCGKKGRFFKAKDIK